MFFYIAAIALILIVIISDAVNGYKKGIFFTGVRFIKIIISGFLAIPIAVFIGKQAEGVTADLFDGFANMSAADSRLYQTLKGFFSGICAAAVYSIIYVILFIILSIIFFFFKSKISVLEKKSDISKKKSSVTGLFAGILCGILGFVFFFTPSVGACVSLSGILHSVNGVADLGEAVDVLDSGLTSVNDGAITKGVWALQKPIFKGVTAFVTDTGKKYDVYGFCTAISDVISHYEPVNAENSLQGVIKAAGPLLDEVKKDGYLCEISASLLSDIGKNFRNGKEYFGITPPSVSKELEPTAIKIYTRLENADPSKLSELLDGIKEILSVLENHPDALEKLSSGSPEELLLDKSLITDLVKQAKTNEETSALLEDVTSGFINTITEKMKENPASENVDADKVINDSVNVIKDAVKNKTEGERKTAIETGIVGILEGNGLNINDDSHKIISGASESLVEYFKDEAVDDMKTYELLPALSDAMEKLGVTYENGQLILPDGIR